MPLAHRYCMRLSIILHAKGMSLHFSDVFYNFPQKSKLRIDELDFVFKLGDVGFQAFYAALKIAQKGVARL